MSGTRSEPPDISIRDGRCRVWTDFTLQDLKSESPEHSTPPSGQKNGFNFSKKTGLEYSVLYPTEGSAYGQVVFPAWATAYAKAYNE